MEVIAGAVVVVIIQAGLEVIEVEVIVIPVLELGRASFVCADSTAEEFNLFCAVLTILC